MNPFPEVLFQLGPLALTSSVVSTFVLSVLLVVVGAALVRSTRTRGAMEIIYETLENAITEMSTMDVRPLVPLVLTQWVFIGLANFVGLVPGLASPTRDLSLAVALALISFVAGHVFAFHRLGFGYLRQYIEPSPFLLPFNIVGEVSRTIALALRLFGNMLSGTLIGAILVYIAGLLVPVPMMLLSVLTAVVQAYIFGVLTLVFAVSAAETAARPSRKSGRSGEERLEVKK